MNIKHLMRSLPVLLVLTLIPSEEAFGQNPSRRVRGWEPHDFEGPEKSVKFSAWPGRGGGFKAGFIFRTSDYPALAGFSVEEDDRSIVEGTKKETTGTLRELVLKKDSDTVLISLEVVQTSILDAHRALLNRLASVQALPRIAFMRGKELGIDVGDINFVPGGTTPADLPTLRAIDFLRNNIRVYVARQGDTVFDVLALAKAIDERIDALPSVKRKELEALLPVISAFSPVTPTVNRSASVELTLTVTNPQGQTLGFQFEHNIGTGISRDETVNPPTTTFFSDFTAGTAMLRAIVLTEGLLHATAKTAVERSSSRSCGQAMNYCVQ
jgi:hypothetical protein